ncbi:MAG: DNA polymerase IV [Acidimicrobiia bacterium]|nr:DNA polymerase IV [Acidimicrobiia bacterium]
MTAPAILHLDLDAFYASVEQRERPELRGRPVVVGGLGNRGVVAAASYEAREFGIRSAMPSVRARRACPDLVFVAPRMDLYAEVSRAVMAILRSATPLVEPLSLDEAFLDVRGAERLLGTGPEIGEMLRARIRSELGLAASVGVAVTKMLAKIASDSAKPDGMWVVEPGTELEFLHPLPVRRLWGVGPATQRRLANYGVETIGDLAALPEATLVRSLGEAAGRQLHALAWNRDPRPVDPHRATKSVGHEETFATDRCDRRALEQELTRMADLVAARLRAHMLVARTVQLKVRFPDFSTITRAQTLRSPTDLSAVIADAARTLLADVEVERGVRLLGVTALQFDGGGAVQEALPFDAPAVAPEQGALERTLDAVRERFGPDAVGRAAHTSDGRVRTDRRGSLWGPDEQAGE